MKYFSKASFREKNWLIAFILILIPLTTGLPEGIENVRTFDNQTSYSLEERNTSIENMHVVSSFQANITERPVEIIFENSTSEYQAWMTENSDLYNGNNIVYDDGLLNIYRGEELKPEGLKRENGFRYNVTRNDSYVLALETFETDYTTVSNGQSCYRVYNYSGLENPEEFNKVNNCQEPNYLKYLLYFLIGVSLIYLTYLVYRKTREKILLHKINKTTEKVKNSGRIDDAVLEDLYQANNYALENQYRKSREILGDIQGKIKSENRNN